MREITLNGLSLFSGAGIGELAFKHILPDYQTIGYVEWDKYCQQVIRARIRDGILDDAPIFGDIRHFNAAYASLYAGQVDWLSAGFPCQPFSVAGRRAGEADERNQWPATRDAIRIIRPRYVLLENVSNLLTDPYIWTIASELSEIGYEFDGDTIGAKIIGGLHERERIWILAYPKGVRCKDAVDGADKSYPSWGLGPQVSTPGSIACDEAKFCEQVRTAEFVRKSNGLADRVDRLKALGNGWVIQCLAAILQVTNQEK